MAQPIPQADLVVVDGAAHLPNLERQTEFNQALHRFGGPAMLNVSSD
jgi:pimeloyl-ACP methyl ester carboxylesterase